MTNPQIRVGIGGWSYEGWRGSFYPAGLPKTRELKYAAARLTAIEVNGTFYSSFKPETFAGWARAAPDGFKFAIKASRYCVTRRVLAEAGESVERFLGQGLTELGDKLGPILWQFADTRRFDPDDMAAFLRLLPASRDGVKLRHAIQGRHESFVTPEFVRLAREAGVAIVFADSATRPALADVTADFVYARLENGVVEEPAGYSPTALDRWAATARVWAGGGRPGDLPYADGEAAPERPRDVFVFFIAGAKERAPHGATALIERLGGGR